MKNYTLWLLVVVLFTNKPIFSQEEVQLTSKDSIVKSSWILGLGFNAVDDSGDVFDDLFAVDSQWNLLPYPSRLSIGRYFKSGIGLEAIGSLNKYKQGKLIDGSINQIESNYLAIDSRISYDLNKLIGQTAWFDPYVGVGLGYTDANNEGRGTYNAVVGFRTWINDNWGLDFSTSGKWAMKTGDGVTNHIQHAAGVVYQFGIEKGLSKKGAEKLDLITAMEKEKQRVQDSIATVNRIREEAALAERLAKEKENARLAAIEKEKMEAERARRELIEQRIDALGYAYFNFNSFKLNKDAKEVLEALAVILNEEPSLQLKIISHTDSRGTKEYNQWLSDQRVNSTKEFLIHKGTSAVRLVVEANGEERLLNECSDGVKCPETKHKVNRRSEFKVIKM